MPKPAQIGIIMAIMLSTYMVVVGLGVPGWAVFLLSTSNGALGALAVININEG